MNSSKISCKFSLLILLFYCNMICIDLANAQNSEIEYYLDTSNSRYIHVFKFSPDEYEMKIVKARPSTIGGRLAVKQIALDIGADFVFNGGFFQKDKRTSKKAKSIVNYTDFIEYADAISNQTNEALPVGALVVDGRIYSMQAKESPMLVQQGGIVSIKRLSTSAAIEVNGELYNIYRYNVVCQKNMICLYNTAYSHLLKNGEMKNFVISKNRIKSEIHEDISTLEPNDFLVSIPSKHILARLQIGDIARIRWSPEYLNDIDTSIVMGRPMLVEDGNIVQGLNKNKLNSRTAFGIDSAGNYLLVIVQNYTDKQINNLQREVLENLMQSNEISISDDKIKQLYRKKSIGISLADLAQYMKKIGAQQAINMDGGGSTSFYQKHGKQYFKQWPVLSAIAFFKKP